MSKFREFPYRGSLLRFQSGAVQEVFHEPMSAKVPDHSSLSMPANSTQSLALHLSFRRSVSRSQPRQGLTRCLWSVWNWCVTWWTRLHALCQTASNSGGPMRAR